MKKFFCLVVMFSLLVFYVGGKSNATDFKEATNMTTKVEIYLAGGCFWGTEHFLKQINGVKLTEVGYANGATKNPTYKEVCEGNTGYAETVKVLYDPKEISLETILELYFLTIDPTSVNKQGGDIGSQYRTGIYYTNLKDKEIVEREVNKLADKYSVPLAIEVKPLSEFFSAELYHQDYLEKNKNGYCHISPKLFEIAKKANMKKTYQKPSDEILRSSLSKMQYMVTQENATEPPFKNEFFTEFREGIYVDITTGEPLFISTDKYESGCGWPAFSKPLDESLIKYVKDNSHNMIRTEVRSVKGDAHLGHVFEDGPKDKGGTRYCINSASLRFISRDNMEKDGYGEYLTLLEKS